MSLPCVTLAAHQRNDECLIELAALNFRYSSKTVSFSALKPLSQYPFWQYVNETTRFAMPCSTTCSNTSTCAFFLVTHAQCYSPIIANPSHMCACPIFQWRIEDGAFGANAPPPPFKKLHTRSRYSNRAVDYSNKAATMFMRQCIAYL